jgi:hypothetical protein
LELWKSSFSTRQSSPLLSLAVYGKGSRCTARAEVKQFLHLPYSIYVHLHHALSSNTDQYQPALLVEGERSPKQDRRFMLRNAAMCSMRNVYQPIQGVENSGTTLSCRCEVPIAARLYNGTNLTSPYPIPPEQSAMVLGFADNTTISLTCKSWSSVRHAYQNSRLRSKSMAMLSIYRVLL